MRAVIQRVSEAAVVVDGQVISSIGQGIFTLIGIQKSDTAAQMQKLMTKICELRIFEDESGKMNRSLIELKGEHLLVSQFTLVADCTSGRRPSFTTAERPELARPLYELALTFGASLGVPTCGGIFQADMRIRLVNEGPVTFILEV